MINTKLKKLLVPLGISLLATGIFIGGFLVASNGRVAYTTVDQEITGGTTILDSRTADGADRRTVPDSNLLQAFQENSRQVARNALPVVVRVDVLKKVAQANNPFRFFFNGQPYQGQQEEGQDAEPRYEGGYGSGIIIQQNGETVYVLTNNHVVAGADKYTIRTHDNKEFEGKLVGTDKNRDIAVVSFTSKEKMPVATLGDSSRAQPGDIVYAVGSPYGIQNTITQGIISAVNRNSTDLPGGGGDISNFTDYLQTDAAINPGNSGGALVNLAGEVIGVNTWIATRTGENVGLGFAVPINNARKVAMDFITKGKVEYGWLGVTPGGIMDANRASLKLEGKEGAFIYNLIKGSPADKSGIQPGDLIIKVDNSVVKSSEDLIRTVASLESNKDVKVVLIRNGREQTLTVRLGLRDENVKSDSYWPGFTAGPLTEEIKRQVKTELAAGTFVVLGIEEGTIAADTGLRPGDEIVSINGRKIGNAADFYEALNGSKGNRQIDMKIKRNGREISLLTRQSRLHNMWYT